MRPRPPVESFVWYHLSASMLAALKRKLFILLVGKRGAWIAQNPVSRGRNDVFASRPVQTIRPRQNESSKIMGLLVECLECLLTLLRNVPQGLGRISILEDHVLCRCARPIGSLGGVPNQQHLEHSLKCGERRAKIRHVMPCAPAKAPHLAHCWKARGEAP